MKTCAILCGLALSAAVGECQDWVARAQAKARAEYESYVEPYRKAPALDMQTGGICLVATIVKGEFSPTSISSTNAEDTFWRQVRIEKLRTAVTTNGATSYAWQVSLRANGGTGQPISQTVMDKQLLPLLARLPDDGGRLPPTGKRVILQIPDGDKWKVRVYNGWNAPLEVRQVLKLIGMKL